MPLFMVPSPLLLTDYAGLLAQLSTSFANPQQAATVNRKIQTLKQGKDSVAQYSTEFKLLAQDLAWNEAALVDQYMEGLADEVLDEQSRVKQPPTLQGLITLCLRIDGHLEGQRQARSSRHLSPVSCCPAPLPTLSPANTGGEECEPIGGCLPTPDPQGKSETLVSESLPVLWQGGAFLG